MSIASAGTPRNGTGEIEEVQDMEAGLLGEVEGNGIEVVKEPDVEGQQQTEGDHPIPRQVFTSCLPL